MCYFIKWVLIRQAGERNGWMDGWKSSTAKLTCDVELICERHKHWEGCWCALLTGSSSFTVPIVSGSSRAHELLYGDSQQHRTEKTEVLRSGCEAFYPWAFTLAPSRHKEAAQRASVAEAEIICETPIYAVKALIQRHVCRTIAHWFKIKTWVDKRHREMNARRRCPDNMSGTETERGACR